MFVPPVVTDDAEGAALLVKLAALLVCCADTDIGASRPRKTKASFKGKYLVNVMIRILARRCSGRTLNRSLHQLL